MNTTETAQRYFNAWNRRDADAIVAMFAPGGTYEDPTTRGPLTGNAIGEYAQSLWAGFPDLSFDVLSVTANPEGLVSGQWLMKGTNSGSFAGLPPTGRSVTLPGADFIQVAGDKISSVQGYFDSAAVPRALGLDVVVQPASLGPIVFGVATRASSGNTATPGAFSITCLEARNGDEKQKVQESSAKVVSEMLRMPGFISWVGVTVGDRMMKISAWESPESIAPLMRGGEHRSATGRFFGPELSRGGATGVWAPLRLNPRWARCASCDRMVDTSHHTCECGAAAPDPLPYW